MFLIKVSFCQIPNLSGTWNGSISTDSTKYNFTLILTLIDSCGPIYSVKQFDGDDEMICFYYFNQTGKILLRDAVSKWKCNEPDSGPAHLKLTYNEKNNSLSGFRMDDDTFTEKIFLKNKKLVNYFYPCNFKHKTTCNEMFPVFLPDKMFFADTNSIVTINIIDNSSNDSDLVTLFVNKNKILENITIYPTVEYSIPVVSNENFSITWCACNQGTTGKNTGSMILREYKNKILIQEKIIDVNLFKNEQTTIFVVRPK